jgi:hypothetical protein
MGFESYKQALLSVSFDDDYSVRRILDAYYHSGTPYVFQEDANAQGEFMRSIASEITAAYKLRCHPHHVVICGSAHLGFSAAPNEKLGTTFSFTKSDIDVAILLPELFDRWWLELVDTRVRLGERRSEIADHLFNGYINPQVVRDYTATGREWWRLFGRLTVGKFNKVRGRIYRDPQFMENYHRLSVLKGRDRLLGARI